MVPYMSMLSPQSISEVELLTGRMEEGKIGKEESPFCFPASLCPFLDGSEVEQPIGKQKTARQCYIWAEPLSQQRVGS